LVGLDGSDQKYTVYRDLLCHHSTYFDRLLNGGFKEAGQDLVRLMEVDSKAFQSFFYWLNTGMIDLYPDPNDLDARGCAGHVVRAYIFADLSWRPSFQERHLERPIPRRRDQQEACSGQFVPNLRQHSRRRSAAEITCRYWLRELQYQALQEGAYRGLP
jgi:hypothetical protein